MGLDRTVRFPFDGSPTWDAIRHQLSRLGETPSIRLIDDLPAFPDETPPVDWKEIRIGTAAGMVTIRRGLGYLTCVVWGNADAALEAVWHQVIWACATAGEGMIESPEGPVTAEVFSRSVGLSPE
jgi:hypothetical protein